MVPTLGSLIYRLAPRLAPALGVAAFCNALPACAGPDEKEIDRTFHEPRPPLNPPPNYDAAPNPPGDSAVYRCVPAENSFLILLRGYGARHPVRELDAQGNATDQLKMSEPREVCSILSLDRLGPAQGQQTEVGVPYWIASKWTNTPNPMPTFDDLDYLDAITLLQGRTLEHPLNNLYRGYSGSEIRRQGSWGEIFALEGLAQLGQDASLVWFFNMKINPDTCQAELSPWQAVRTPDGLKTAETTKDLLVGPCYRKEACAGVEAFDLADLQTVTVCDESNPCQTLGSTELQRLEASFLALPIEGNGDGGVPILSGALASFEDEGIVVLDLKAGRPVLSYQLDQELVPVEVEPPDGGFAPPSQPPQDAGSDSDVGIPPLAPPDAGFSG